MLRADTVAEVTPEIADSEGDGTVAGHAFDHRKRILQRSRSTDRDQIETAQFIRKNQSLVGNRGSHARRRNAQQQTGKGRKARG